MTEETNRERAISFLEMIVKNQIDLAYRKYTSPDFIHHNPFFAGDRESLKLGMEEDAKQNPNKIISFKFSLEDGNRVMTYSHIKVNEKDIGIVAVHNFRFENDKIVEIWGVHNSIPEEQINENGMF